MPPILQEGVSSGDDIGKTRFDRPRLQTFLHELSPFIGGPCEAHKHFALINVSRFSLFLSFEKWNSEEIYRDVSFQRGSLLFPRSTRTFREQFQRIRASFRRVISLEGFDPN